MSTSIRLRKIIAKNNEARAHEAEMDPDSVDNSFWFSREDDEKFEGKLLSTSPDEELQKSKEYADFLAASAHMSLQSFVGFNRHSSTGVHQGALIANEVLPLLENPPTWGQWLWHHKFSALAVGTSVLATLFLALFVIPVTQLNNSQQDCRVVGFDVSQVQCPTGENGYCVEQLVEALLQPQEQFITRVFSGFPLLQSRSCAISNCSGEPIPIPSELPESCEIFLENIGQSAQNLSEVELLGCAKIGEDLDCVHVRKDSAATKRWYFPDLEKSVSVEGDILSSPKQPSQQVVIFSSVLIFAMLAFYFVFAVISEVSNNKI